MGKRSRILHRDKSLTERAADDIRARIVFGDIALGASLSENTLASELGVSKTPVREALLQLKSEGLVSIQPQRGSFVFDMSASEVMQLGDLRETLELAAVRAAMKNDVRALVGEMRGIVEEMRKALDRDDAAAYRQLDADFHRAFFEHSGNVFLLASYLGIAFRIQALRSRLSSDPALNQISYGEHLKITNLVEAGRAGELAKLLSKHVCGTSVAYIATLDARRLRAS